MNPETDLSKSPEQGGTREMKFYRKRWVQILGVVLPLIGAAVTTWVRDKGRTTVAGRSLSTPVESASLFPEHNIVVVFTGRVQGDEIELAVYFPVVQSVVIDLLNYTDELVARKKIIWASRDPRVFSFGTAGHYSVSGKAHVPSGSNVVESATIRVDKP